MDINVKSNLEHYMFRTTPDTPTKYNFIALGYSDNRAHQKVIKSCNALRNKTRRVIDSMTVNPDQIWLVNWKDEVDSNPIFQQEYQKLMELFATETKFQSEVLDSTRNALHNLCRKDIPSIELSSLKIGARYLLQELAFFEFMSQTINEGTIDVIYHKEWPVLENFIFGKYDRRTRDYLRFCPYLK